MLSNLSPKVDLTVDQGSSYEEGVVVMVMVMVMEVVVVMEEEGVPGQCTLIRAAALLGGI